MKVRFCVIEYSGSDLYTPQIGTFPWQQHSKTRKYCHKLLSPFLPLLLLAQLPLCSVAVNVNMFVGTWQP